MSPTMAAYLAAHPKGRDAARPGRARQDLPGDLAWTRIRREQGEANAGGCRGCL